MEGRAALLEGKASQLLHFLWDPGIWKFLISLRATVDSLKEKLIHIGEITPSYIAEYSQTSQVNFPTQIMASLPPIALLLLLALATLATAQTNPVCCTSKQWRGEVHSNFFEQTQNSSGLQVLSSVFREHLEYDAINQRLRVDTVEWDQETGDRDNYTAIFLYQTGKYYFFYGPGNGTQPTRTCVVTSLTPPYDKFYPACVESGFQHRQQMVIGGPNAEHMTTDFFFYPQISGLPGSGGNAQVSPGCWPVSGTFFQHQKQLSRFGRVEATYYDLQDGINSNAFTIPSTCSTFDFNPEESCKCGGCNINGVSYCCPKSSYKACGINNGVADCVCGNGSPCTTSC